MLGGRHRVRVVAAGVRTACRVRGAGRFMSAARWPYDRASSAPPSRLDPPTVLGVMADLDLDLDRARSAPPATSIAAASVPAPAPPPVRPRPLPEGARLLDFDIVGLLGEGGFGIVYLAYDGALERHVAIKEYLPAALAARVGGTPAVAVRSPRHADAFQIGLRSFVNEARLLARFDHPSLVKVLRFWEGNGTAYMVMPFYEGRTLAHTLETLGRPPDEAQLRAWLRPLLHALSTLHAARCYHRDIAPDNILLTPGGPLLLDFGAARRVVGSRGETPTVVFKPGYAPIEQYGEAPTLKQGPWTDLYALAAVVYAAVTGQPPTPALERWRDDRLQPLAERAQGRYSAAFLATIDAALSLQPADRPASAAAFWTGLNGPVRAVPLETATPEAFAVAPGDAADAGQAPSGAPDRPALAGPSLPRQASTAGVVAPPAIARRGVLGALLLLLALALALALAWMLGGVHRRPPVDGPPAASPTPRGMPSPPAVAVAAQQPAPPVASDAPSLRAAPAAERAGASPSPPASASPPAAAAPGRSATPLRQVDIPPSPAARPVAARAAPSSPPEARASGNLPPTRGVGVTADVDVDATRRRCSEILQRASIEPIRSAEAAFLKRECRP